MNAKNQETVEFIAISAHELRTYSEAQRQPPLP